MPGSFRPEERPAFESFLDDLPGPFLVLMMDGGVVGCGGVAVEAGPRRLCSLCWGMVHADLHRRGLGRVLLEARIRACETTGECEALRLETIPETAGFFERHGFQVTRTDPDGYGPGLPRTELERPIRRAP